MANLYNANLVNPFKPVQGQPVAPMIGPKLNVAGPPSPPKMDLSNLTSGPISPTSQASFQTKPTPMSPITKSIVSAGSSLASGLKSAVTTVGQKVASALPKMPQTANISSAFQSSQSQPSVVTTPSTFNAPGVPAQITPQAPTPEYGPNRGMFQPAQGPTYSGPVAGPTPSANYIPPQTQDTQSGQSGTGQLKQLDPVDDFLGQRQMQTTLGLQAAGGPDTYSSSFGSLGNSGAMGSMTGGKVGGYSGLGGTPTLPSLSDDGSYDELKKRYLESLQESPEEKEAREKLEALTSSYELGQAQINDKPIAMQFITGQQRGLEDRNAALSKPLSYRLAAEQARRQGNQKQLGSMLEFENADREHRLAQQKLAYEQSKPDYQSGIVGEYQFARQNGYQGSFEQYQNEDANRRSQASGLSSSNINSTINSIANSFDNEPIVKDYNTVLSKKMVVDKILSSGLGGPGDLAIVYEFMKALDPTSVVRETEYASAAKSGNIFQGVLAKFNGYFKEQGGFLPENVKQGFQSIINSKLQVQQQLFKSLQNEYNRRIDEVKGGGYNTLTDYSQADTPTPVPGNQPVQPTPQSSDPMADLADTISGDQSKFKTREQLIDSLIPRFPELTKDQIASKVYTQIPDKPQTKTQTNVFTTQKKTPFGY